MKTGVEWNVILQVLHMCICSEAYHFTYYNKTIFMNSCDLNPSMKLTIENMFGTVSDKEQRSKRHKIF